MPNNKADKYQVIGLMSGTSLDGLDIAFCNIEVDPNSQWTYEIIHAETVSYSANWKNKLLELEVAPAMLFNQVHNEYGSHLGELVNDFIEKYNIKPDFIASHGHTIFHQPQKGYTVQVGAGYAIAAKTSLPVVCDFRSLDVALGGQGAPLVPIGDKLLFSNYDFCLNLGGFANVSYEYNGKRIAFDICPVNIVMNAICNQVGKEYDANGDIAATGNIHPQLLEELNALPFYHLPSNTPKSLGKEWVLATINPLLAKYELPESDALRTFCEHIAIQIGKALQQQSPGKLLATGGGTYNSFLLQVIKQNTQHLVEIPNKKTIEFKEALIFALLGVLRMRNQNNCLMSVTGSSRDNCGGAIYQG